MKAAQVLVQYSITANKVLITVEDNGKVFVSKYYTKTAGYRVK